MRRKLCAAAIAAAVVLLYTLPALAVGPVKPTGCTGTYQDVTAASTTGNDTISYVFTSQRGCGTMKAGVDSFSGTDDYPKGDVIWGGDGADWLDGAAGADVLIGEGGPDGLWGDTGDDTEWGDSHDDEVTGGGGDDVLFDGTGNDTLQPGTGFDTWYKCEDADADTVNGTFEAIVGPSLEYC